MTIAVNNPTISYVYITDALNIIGINTLRQLPSYIKRTSYPHVLSALRT